MTKRVTKLSVLLREHFKFLLIPPISYSICSRWRKGGEAAKKIPPMWVTVYLRGGASSSWTRTADLWDAHSHPRSLILIITVIILNHSADSTSFIQFNQTWSFKLVVYKSGSSILKFLDLDVWIKQFAKVRMILLLDCWNGKFHGSHYFYPELLAPGVWPTQTLISFLQHPFNKWITEK